MKKKCIAVWMDHASANLIKFINGGIENETITSTITHKEKQEILYKGDKALHHKEQHEELTYYKQIAKVILNFEDVLLFGPTEAKDELLNLLKADHRFNHINIETRTFDKLTKPKQEAFAKDFFENHLSNFVVTL